MLTNCVKLFSSGSLSSCQICRKSAINDGLRCFATVQAIKTSSSRKLSSNLVTARVLSVRKSSSSSSSSRATGLDIVSPLIGLSGAIRIAFIIMRWKNCVLINLFEDCSQNEVLEQRSNLRCSDPYKSISTTIAR